MSSLDTRPQLPQAIGGREPTRVVHCLWDGEIGGAERAVYQLVREQLHDSELSPAVLFAQGHGPYWERAKRLGCPVTALDLPHGRALRSLRKLAKALSVYDIHHFHSAEPLLMLASARSGSACRVYTHRGGIVDYPLKKRLQYGLVGLHLRRSFHGVSGNTRHAASCAAELFHIDEHRFHVTYNGLEFELLEPTRTPEEVRRELGLGPGEFVLGTAAKLKAWKRIERLLAALAALSDSRVRLLVVGDGPDRERLHSLARRLGVEGSTIFTGAQDHVADYLQVMNGFCLPSMGLESFGNAAVEAMALGIPTIVFADGGGMLEHIERGRTGFVVGDQEELVAAIRWLLEDPSGGAEVGARARAEVRSRYTPEKAAGAYRTLYASALRTASPPPRVTEGIE